MSDILQYVELNLWSKDQCKKAFDDFNDAHNDNIQFNEDGLEICAYDKVIEIRVLFCEQYCTEVTICIGMIF